MQDHLTCALDQACTVWRHYLDRYLSPEPGEICIPRMPLHEATEFVILTLEHFLPPEPTLKIADGLAIAAFYEVLRERTAGRSETFSVARLAHTWPPDDALAAPSTPDPTHLEARSTADAVARARWYSLLPRGLPDAEYEVYRFRQLRDHVFREATAALVRRLPSTEAAQIAWAATHTGFYSAVAAMEFDDPE
jgi:hypothetical protein